MKMKICCGFPNKHTFQDREFSRILHLFVFDTLLQLQGQRSDD